jgi:hypothetical protein
LAGFEAHPEPVGQSIDEVEIGRDLYGLEDAAIVQSRIPERCEVPTPDPTRLERQLLGEREDGTEPLRQLGAAPIPGEVEDESCISSDLTERRPVMCDSVTAPVRRGHDDRDRFTLRPGQSAPTEHQCSIDLIVLSQRIRVKGLTQQDVSHRARSSGDARQHLFQVAGRLSGIDRPNPGRRRRTV